MLVMTVFCLFQVTGPTASLTLSRDSIALGDSVVLRWTSSGADRAFLVPVGDVPPAGSRTVTPDERTSYILSVEGPGGQAVHAVAVAVGRASKGSDVPDRAEFTATYSFRYASTSRDALLQRVQAALQDSLYHSLRPSLQADSSIVLETNRVLRPELVPRTETRIASRRAAVRITIASRPTGGVWAYTVETCLEYQRRAEKTWRAERDTELHHRHAERLHQLIGPGP